MLDGVIQNGDAGWKIIAQHAKGDLYVAMMVRMRNTIPPYGSSTTASALADLDLRHTMLEPRLDEWREHADASFAQVQDLASENPQFAFANPVVASAITSSQVTRTGVASR